MTECGYYIWPYTENNRCVLPQGHDERLHEDAKGRKFDHVSYVDKEK